MDQNVKMPLKQRLIIIGVILLACAVAFGYGWHFAESGEPSSLVMGGFLILAIWWYIVKKSEWRKKWFAKIETCEDALLVINEAAGVYYAVAALQLILGVIILNFSDIGDAIILLLLGFLLKKYNSRICAVLLFLLSLGQAIVTVLNWLEILDEGGKNIFWALMVIVASIRSIEATFLIHKLNQADGKLPTLTD